MTSHRFLFYSRDVTKASSAVELRGEEHRHLARVLRCRVGEETYVTNGAGLILRCRAQSVGKTLTKLEVVSVEEAREPEPAFILALAVLKKDKFESALEQCVELGITRCVPFIARASRLKNYSQNYMSRLDKVALAAVKQAFRPFLVAVDDPVDFNGLIGLCKNVDRVVLGDQGAPPPSPRRRGENVMLVVGPEAGLTDEETEALKRAGARTASVSPFRLRAETAAAALVAVLGHPV